MRRVVALCISVCLVGCYRPDATKLVKDVHQKVVLGMSATDAVQALHTMNLNCSNPPYLGTLQCSRLVQSWLLSCVEHVNLVISQDDSTVREIQLPQAACIGTP